MDGTVRPTGDERASEQDGSPGPSPAPATEADAPPPADEVPSPQVVYDAWQAALRRGRKPA